MQNPTKYNYEYYSSLVKITQFDPKTDHLTEAEFSSLSEFHQSHVIATTERYLDYLINEQS